GFAAGGSLVITGLGRSTVSGGAIGFVSTTAGGGSAAAGGAIFGSFAAAGSTVAGFAASPSSTATTLFTFTVSPSFEFTSVSVPAAGEVISASTLSVEISKSGSSRST